MEGEIRQVGCGEYLGYDLSEFALRNLAAKEPEGLTDVFFATDGNVYRLYERKERKTDRPTGYYILMNGRDGRKSVIPTTAVQTVAVEVGKQFHFAHGNADSPTAEVGRIVGVNTHQKQNREFLQKLEPCSIMADFESLSKY